MFISDRINVTKTKRTYTDEGYLKVPCRIARIGIQEYYAYELGLTDREPTDIVKIYRSPDEVFKSESMASFENKPITDGHPDELVNAKNFREYSSASIGIKRGAVIGFSGNKVHRDNMFLVNELLITDVEAIKKIESGTLELSNGYVSVLTMESGTTDEGETYDGYQQDIVGNHIALVDRGRAGSECRIADTLLTEDQEMPKILIDGVEFEAPAQTVQAVEKIQQQLSDCQDVIAGHNASVSDEAIDAAVTKQTSTLQAQLDDALSKVLTPEQLDNLVSNRVQLVDAVRKLDDTYDWAGKDDQTVKLEIVKLKCPTIDADKLSDDYVNARFDILVENIDTNPQTQLDEALQHQVLTVSDQKPVKSMSELAREKMIENNRNAWKKTGDER